MRPASPDIARVFLVRSLLLAGFVHLCKLQCHRKTFSFLRESCVCPGISLFVSARLANSALVAVAVRVLVRVCVCVCACMCVHVRACARWE